MEENYVTIKKGCLTQKVICHVSTSVTHLREVCPQRQGAKWCCQGLGLGWGMGRVRVSIWSDGNVLELDGVGVPDTVTVLSAAE
jgi:hypothetical protein